MMLRINASMSIEMQLFDPIEVPGASGGAGGAVPHTLPHGAAQLTRATTIGPHRPLPQKLVRGCLVRHCIDTIIGQTLRNLTVPTLGSIAHLSGRLARFWTTPLLRCG